MRIYRKQQGMTILELLVVLSIVSLLTVVAVPSLQESTKGASVRSLHRDLLSALTYARGEAVSRNKLISMCPSADMADCDPANDWSEGWIIFIDNGAGGRYGDGDLDAGEELLRVYDYRGTNMAFVKDPDDSLSALNSLSWNFRGFMQNDQRALISVCDPDGTPRHTRGLLLERSGRVIKTRDLDNDGVHETAFENSSGSAVIADLGC